MYILKLLSFYRDEDYEIKPLKEDAVFHPIRKLFHKPKLKNWALEKSVENLVNFYIKGDGSIQSEDDIISVEYQEVLEFRNSRYEIVMYGTVIVKGEALDYNSEYRQKLIQADLKKRSLKD